MVQLFFEASKGERGIKRFEVYDRRETELATKCEKESNKRPVTFCFKTKKQPCCFLTQTGNSGNLVFALNLLTKESELTLKDTNFLPLNVEKARPSLC